jgi:arabinogalactan endo-1,4-beta-galactosidase
MARFTKGADVSSLLELERLGARYRDARGERDLLDILAANGVNAVRLRLWNDPRSEAGEPYGAGGNDLTTTVALARRVRAQGLDLLLCLHYSDFWADPGKQLLPKAWRGLDEAGLERAVYDFTRATLLALRAAGAPPQLVQVGNELTNGLLWPLGRAPAWDAIARFVKAGVRAVREVLPEAEVMVHLDQGGNNALYREWFDAFLARGGELDVMGLSYYPFWHGPMDALAANLDDLARRYGRDLVVVETSMGFTLADYAAHEGLAPGERKGMATRPELAARVPYPMTPAGQRDFLRDLVGVVRRVPGGRGRGLYWWEPAWLPVKGGTWATPAALRYLGAPGPGGNEWSNQALFDYDGNALPALALLAEL